MTEEDDDGGVTEDEDEEDEDEEDGGDYHEPHYVNKVQGHVPVKPQCRAK